MAFQEVPGVMVQKTSHGQGSPYVRGFTGYHNLFLIDGIRLNHAAMRSGPNQYWNLVDGEGLGALELVKSQGSVLYGTDAVGGTVQALTLRPRYAEEGSLVGGRTHTRYGSGDGSLVQRVEGMASEAGEYGLLMGGTIKEFGDIDAAGLGRLPKTGYGEWDVDGKFEYFLGESARLTAFHQQVHQDDVWRAHTTEFGRSWRGTEVGSERARILDQSRMLSYIQLAGEAENALFDRYTFSVSHQRHGEEQYRERADGRTDIQGFDLDSYGVWGQFDRDLDWTGLVYGFGYYQDRSDSFRDDFDADGSLRERQIQGPVGDDGVYHLADVFINSSTPLGGRMTLDLGARYTYAEAAIGKVESPETGRQIPVGDDWGSVVGSGRISYRLDEADEWRLFGGVSQAFRAPNFSDLSRLDSNRSGEIETPSPGLDPEEFVTLELGVKARTERLGGGLSYFFTDVNDLILRTPTGRTVDGMDEVTKSNVGDGYVHGVEMEMGYELGRGWSVFGGVSWQDSLVSTFATSEPEIGDWPQDRQMPLTGFGGLRIDGEGGKWWAEGLVMAAGAGDRLSPGDMRDRQRIPPEGTPSYWLATLRGGLRLGERVTISGAVQNIFDEEYRIHGSGQNEPGVNVVIGAEIKF